MNALWVAKDTAVKRTAKTGHCRDVPIDLSRLCSVGFAFRLKWIGVVLTRLFIIIVELGSFQGQMSH